MAGSKQITFPTIGVKAPCHFLSDHGQRGPAPGDLWPGEGDRVRVQGGRHQPRGRRAGGHQGLPHAGGGADGLAKEHHHQVPDAG